MGREGVKRGREGLVFERDAKIEKECSEVIFAPQKSVNVQKKSSNVSESDKR